MQRGALIETTVALTHDDSDDRTAMSTSWVLILRAVGSHEWVFGWGFHRITSEVYEELCGCRM